MALIPLATTIGLLVAKGTQLSTLGYRIFKSVWWELYISACALSGQLFLLWRRRLAYRLWGVERHDDGAVTLRARLLAFELVLQLYMTASLLALAISANRSLAMWPVALKAAGFLAAGHAGTVRRLCDAGSRCPSTVRLHRLCEMHYPFGRTRGSVR